jgi:uncharacterized protein (TIGR01777 family)
MRVLITGGTGLIGSKLVPFLVDKSIEVILLTRSQKKINKKGVKYLQWDGSNFPDLPEKPDAIINLAGAGIMEKRWTKAYKKELQESRINSTSACVRYINANSDYPIRFISASAIGIYSSEPKKVFSENSIYTGVGFLHETSTLWELEANKSTIEPVILRIGIVLSTEGGALPALLPLFKAGFGSPIGSGEQGFPWIHIEDLTALIGFFLLENKVSGNFNACANDQCTNRVFSSFLASFLKKPLWPAVPSFLIKVILGERSASLLDVPICSGKKIAEAGFRLKFTHLQEALKDLLK